MRTEPLPGLLAGIDEAGRGPLAGPVFAAAVILDPDHPIAGLADSKTVSAVRREALARQIRRHALAWHVASADAAEIDALNILQATLLAMRRACAGLASYPVAQALVDGRQLPPGLPYPARAVVRGDATVPAIAAASILAKTVRDAWCLDLHERFPEYGFDRHKGYPTALHLERLALHGPCAEHRRSFGPVRRALSQRATP
ncbi:MAG: ribonuclease HII [Castellaniella sp.]